MMDIKILFITERKDILELFSKYDITISGLEKHFEILNSDIFDIVIIDFTTVKDKLLVFDIRRRTLNRNSIILLIIDNSLNLPLLETYIEDGADDFIFIGNLKEEIDFRIKKLILGRKKRLKVNEFEIKNKGKLLVTIIDIVPNPIYYKDLHGNILGCNKAFKEFFGIKENTKLPIRDKKIFDKETVEKLYDIEKQLLNGESKITYSTILPDRDGNLRNLTFYKSLFFYSDGRPAGVIGVIYDMTAQKLYEKQIWEQKEKLENIVQKMVIQKMKIDAQNQELKNLNMTKDKFFSIIAHDLKNPFHNILGFIEIILTKYDKLPDEKKIRYLNYIKESAQQSSNLLENLLNWSRTQTGRIRYQPKIFPVYEPLEITLAIIKPNADKKEITIHTDIDKNHKVRADFDMVSLIFRNLISNAIKFTPEKGSIRIFSEIKDDMVHISVSDTGIGIPEDMKNKLFRVDESISRKGTNNETGTGLGLILCKEFIKKNNGDIWAHGSEDKGAVFTFSLPKA